MKLIGSRRSGPVDWPALQALLQVGRFAATVDALRDLDEARRAELGKQLVALPRRADTWFTEEQATAYAVAAVGCVSSAAKAVTVLTRHGWPWSPILSQPVLRAAADRGVPWLGELAGRLAERLPRDASFEPWRFTTDLLLAAGAPTPSGERFVDGWLLSLRTAQRRTSVLDELRASPFTDTLLPLAFERDGIAALVGLDDPVNQKWTFGPGILFAVAALVEEGRFQRADALEHCLGRLLGSRSIPVLAGFLRFHEVLAPTGPEVAERVTIYLKLLADAAGSVATMAQKVLRTADEAGNLELESLLDVSRTVLGRSEKGLVKAQLIWLDKVAKRLPARGAEIAGVVAVAADHPDVQARDRAGAFLARHGQAFPPGPAQVAEPAPDLLPEPVAAADMPAPIASPDELAEEVAVLSQTGWQMQPVERVLAAVVRMHSTDPVALRAALAPVMQRAGDHLSVDWWAAEVHREAGALFTAALNKAAGLPFELAGATRVLRGTPADVWPANPYAKLQGVLMARLAEVVVRLSTQAVPALVATPTRVNGLLDPAVLVERLARAEREGWQPWAWDLRQALYRLPLDVDADALQQARMLRSEPGRALVEWLEAGGTGRPEVGVVRVPRPSPERGRQVDWMPESRFYAASKPDPAALDPDRLTELAPPPVINIFDGSRGWSPLWPSVLPAQREVVAACLLPLIAASADLDANRGDARLLPLIADLTGPAGTATFTAVAYGLAASQADERIAALDALLTLGALADVDGAALGTQLARLASSKLIILSRAVTQLEEAARIAPALTWQVASGALSGLLPAEHAARAAGAATTPTPSAANVAAGSVAVPSSSTVPGSAAVVDSSAAARVLAAARALAVPRSSTVPGSSAVAGSAAVAASSAVPGSAAVPGSSGAAGSSAVAASSAVVGSSAARVLAAARALAVARSSTVAGLPAAAGSAVAAGASAVAGASGAAGADGQTGGKAGKGRRPAHVTPRGLPDLLTVASTAAAASGSRGEVAGLAELAGRTGSTRLVVEARRLHRVLTSG